MTIALTQRAGSENIQVGRSDLRQCKYSVAPTILYSPNGARTDSGASSAPDATEFSTHLARATTTLLLLGTRERLAP